MRGLGTLVNVLAVLAGGGLGMLIKSGLKRRFRDILMQACGIATIFLGISGALAGLLKVENGAVSTQNTMLLIFSLVLGGLAGEALNIEAGMEALGERLKRLVRDRSDSRFVDGFVTASLVICVGAMAIVGSIQDGLTGDHTLLFSKALLDFVIVMVFGATFGIGVLFSALPLGVLQGGITLAAALVAGFLSEALISDLSCVGSVLIFCVGLNVAFNTKIRVGNLLPALLVPVLWALF
ncbi:DUF554 domain-containing protein [Allofournierella sp.]|uniref:DUF554 domain-containing protein n=1 Tax=Allofournierella sp. TaxID=1940256 RepID=UPI003AB1DCF9